MFLTPATFDLEAHIKRQQNNPDPNVQRVIQYTKNNPNEAKKQICKIVNENKDKIITEWLNYILKENDIYQQHPCFQYLMLNEIFKSTYGKSEEMPLTQNAAAVASIFTNIKPGNINIQNAYQKALSEVAKQTSEFLAINEKDGWIRIPSKKNDPQNYDENEKKLTNLSQGTGWCTANGMAKEYLPNGDFWMYLEGNRAKVAIRFFDKQIVEIQGHGNNRPYKYWPQIKNLIETKNFPQNGEHYKELLAIETNSEAYKKDAEAFKMDFIPLLAEEPNLIWQLDPQIANSDEEIIETAKYAFIEKASSNLISFDLLPKNLQNDTDILNANKTYWVEKLPSAAHLYNGVPDKLKNEPEIIDAYKKGLCKRIQNVPKEYEKLPNEFKDDKQFEECYKNGFANILKHDVDYYSSIPEKFKEDSVIIKALAIAIAGKFYKAKSQNQTGYNYSEYTLKAIQSLIDTLPNSIKNSVTFYEHILHEEPTFLDAVPSAMQEKNEISEAAKQGVLNSLRNDKYRDSYYNSDYEFFERIAGGDPEFYKELKQFYMRQSKNTPFGFKQMPDKLKNDAEILSSYKESWLNDLKNHNAGWSPFSLSTKWHMMPDYLQNDRDIYNVTKDYMIKRLRLSWYNYEECPKQLQNDPDILKFVVKNLKKRLLKQPTFFRNRPLFSHLKYIPEIQKALISGYVHMLEDGGGMNYVDDEFKNLPSIIKANKKGWLKRLYLEPASWRECPYIKEPEMLEANKRGYMRQAQEFPRNWSWTYNLMPAEIQNDPEILALPQTKNYVNLNKKQASGWYQRIKF